MRRVCIAQGDVVALGGMLHGEDHLASIHGEPGRADQCGRVVVSILTTSSRALELDAWLADVRSSLDLELVV